MENFGYYALRSLSILLFQLPIIIILVVYLSKKSTTEGILLLIGETIATMVSLFYNIILPVFINNDTSNYDPHTLLYSIVGISSTIGAGFFTIGFVMLISKIIKAKSEKSELEKFIEE